MEMGYKIYYNDSFIQITDDRSQMNKKNATVIGEGQNAEFFFRHPQILFDGVTNKNLFFVVPYPQKILKKLKDKTDLVIAGGGIVTNENKELLLIHRKGKWDLPKGKIEESEKIIEGARREVEEETGVKVEKVNKSAILTLHAYRMKGKDCLKETHWFEMKAVNGQTNPTPQVEEGIDEVRWVRKEDLKKYKDGCYKLIWDLISKWANI